MALADYRRKRDFKRTAEPAGGKAKRGKALRFVVQKHEASHLHYDFRLEFGGVLKSWAVPKGPSMNTADKRLAMHVEDHPVEYGTFEGTIPEGNYGAGTVMLWDAGTYRPYEDDGDVKKAEKILAGQYRKGHLTVILEGEKLKGEFALIKMKGRGENAWLLLKKGDEYATATDDVTAQDLSVKTGRGMDEIAAGKKPRKRAKPKAGKARPVKKEAAAPKPEKTAPPKDLVPMFATLVDEPFDREGWIFESKWDGYRGVAEVRKGTCKLYSRSRQDFTQKYAAICEELADLTHDAVLDGEIVVMGKDGNASFQLLQQYAKTGEGTLKYQVFDLLHLDGYDTRDLPLLERKKLLKKLLPKNGKTVRYQEHVETDGKRAFKEAVAEGHEGVMAKNGDSAYRTGQRSEDWLKVKSHRRQEVVIGGFTEPRNSRSHFGSLIVGVYDGKKLVYSGHVGGGFNAKSLADTYAKLKPLIRKKSAFADVPKGNEKPTWVQPKLVAEVSFQEWTGDGRMRQPIFQGLRMDKKAALVKREVEKRVPPELLKRERKHGDGVGEQDGLVSHPGKVFWPKDGFTKGHVAAYYKSMAHLILPYLKDRPQSLNRHPNGIEGQNFYQKNVEHDLPDFVETVKIHSESNGKDIRYLVCQNEETLLYLANLGCIEINPWNSRLGSLLKPDWMVADLDPEDIGFESVIETARAVHEVLEAAGIESVCKTSGKTGLHIFAPAAAKYDYDQIKQFALIVGGIVNRMLPDITSLERRPKDRQKKVYLDMLQNNKGQTLACPYSIRPWPGATVSMPLQWEEVKKGLDPKEFTIENAAERAKNNGDLFKTVLGKGFDMKKALAKLRKAYPEIG